MEMSTDDKVRLAAEAINAADALLVTAGAGMGVDSGLPDFRGTQGFWRAYPVIAKLGLSFEDMANPAWFRDDPALAWAFYGHRLTLYRKTMPHHGFNQLLEIGTPSREAILSSRRTWTDIFRKPVLRPNELLNATAPSNTSNAPRRVLMRFGMLTEKW